MEGHSHYSVGQEERLLDAITMVHIDIEVENPRMEPKQLQDGEHNIIGVAEPTGLALLGVVQPPTPVNADIGIAGQEHMRRIYRPSTGVLTELIEPTEPGTIPTLTHMKLILPLAIGDDLLPVLILQEQHVVGVPEPIAAQDVLAHVVLKVVDVLGVVEPQQLLPGGLPRAVHVQVPVQVEALD